MKNCAPLVIALVLLAIPARSATVLVLRFQNASPFADLSWIGESVAQKLKWEIFASRQAIVGTDAEHEALEKLQLRPGANFTKATLLKLGQQAEADYICYGTVDVQGDAQGSVDPAKLKESSVQLAAHFLDLRKRREGKDFSEAGKLADLSRLEEHLAWQALNFLEPEAQHPLEQFMTSAKFVRLEAEESYARGMLVSSGGKRTVWLRQANALDPRFESPVYELGLLALESKKNSEAVAWFKRIPVSDARYGPARFRLGVAAYLTGDATFAANDFRELLRIRAAPEIYNNLGVAESRTGAPTALDDLRRALETDKDDTDYRFNLGAALLRNSQFDEASKLLIPVVQADSEDEEAQALLLRAQHHEGIESGKTATQGRLKMSMDDNRLRPQIGAVHP